MEQEILVEIEEDEAQEHPSLKKWKESAQKLKIRCQKANIEYEEEYDDLLGNLIRIKMPAGRETRSISIVSSDHLENILSTPFEKYSFLKGYSAIVSYEDGIIEAVVSPINSRASITLVGRRLWPDQTSGKPGPDIEIVKEEGGPRLSLGKLSDPLRSLLNTRGTYSISLKLKGHRGLTHDTAIQELEKLSNSLFFQIDLMFDLPLILSREKSRLPSLKKKGSHQVSELQYPQTEYADAPISLYWYAGSAFGMPLLRFLAYYQVLEFYFPIYYQAEAQRKIKAILKDPSFRVERATDLGKIIGSLKASRSGGFGDERSQLRATIQETVDAEELRAFLTDNEEKIDFFSKRTKGLTDESLPLKNDSIDLREAVAKRIYEIRCKIVHMKSDHGEDETDILLPFSKAASTLHFDIDLLQFIARKVLIFSATTLT